MTVRALCIAIGYLFGLFQTSYIIGRLHGIDIREHGSGNAGTTNMMRTMGKKAGLLTLLGDCLKCVLAVAVVWLLFGRRYDYMFPLLKFYTAAGVILGHNYPFYLHFRGGKGIAATAGLGLVFHPLMLLLGLLVFAVTFFTTHYVSLGSLLIYVGVVIELPLFGQMGLWGMEQRYLNELYIVAVLLALLAFWKHRSNIRRLLDGTERKTYLGGSKEGK